MIVAMWMARELVCVEPAMSICSAAGLMAENKIRRLPVAHRNGDGLQLLGLLSATDLFRAFPPNRSSCAKFTCKA